MKKIFLCMVLLVLSLSITGCTKRNEFFTDKQLEKFGLNNLTAPNNSANYYNKSKNYMLICYMNVDKDDDIINFVLDILNMLETNDMYEVYGYAKEDDMFKKERKIYLSRDINDYLINTKNYSVNSVTFNSYEIYYSLSDESKSNSMYILTITSYTEDNTNYLSGYNLIISVVRKNAANYTVVTE